MAGQSPSFSLKLPVNMFDTQAMLAVNLAQRFDQGLTVAQSHVHFSARLRGTGHTDSPTGHATAAHDVHEPWNLW